MNTVWRLIDSKPGHQNQTAGLCHALARITPTECIDIEVRSRGWHFVEWVTGRFSLGNGLPAPDLIIGAGHATHFALLAAKRCYGGRSVVLMKPSLPLGLFDLCIAPEHDDARGVNVLSTNGVINTVTPSLSKDNEQLLILIGGESKHCRWDDQRVIQQISEVVQRSHGVPIKVTNSRRTPDSFLKHLQEHELEGVEVVPWRQTHPGWVSTELAKSKTVWVTPDSVSMVYEAITSGASVGLFDLPKIGAGRVNKGVDRLCREKKVTPFQIWKPQGELYETQDVFCESDRCANWILNKWLIER